MQSVVVGWKNGMMSMAYTYVLDVGETELWFGHLGKGGAHWEPGRPLLVREEYGDPIARRKEELVHDTGVDLGMVAGKAILDKYLAEIAENYERYAAEGRPALAGSKRTFSMPRSEFASGIELVDEMPKKGPPAVRGMGPFVKGTQGGKDLYLAVTPDSQVDAAGLLEALR